MPYLVNIRNRRQITLPRQLLVQIDASIGDKLVFDAQEDKLIAKPVKEQVVDTLSAIQKAFQKSKVTEKGLQESGQKIREKLTQKLYG